MRSLVYYVAASIDGFIAGPNGQVDAFPTDPATLAAIFETYPETCPAAAREAFGITAPATRFDAVIMGAATHLPALDAGLTSAYPHLQQYVVSHRSLPPDPAVTRIEGDIATFVSDLKNRRGHDIWLCGGGDLAGQLIDLIDEIQVKVNPVFFGAGIPVLRLPYGPRPVHLRDTRALPGGVVFNSYRLG